MKHGKGWLLVAVGMVALGACTKNGEPNPADNRTTAPMQSADGVGGGPGGVQPTDPGIAPSPGVAPSHEAGGAAPLNNHNPGTTTKPQGAGTDTGIK